MVPGIAIHRSDWPSIISETCLWFETDGSATVTMSVIGVPKQAPVSSDVLPASIRSDAKASAVPNPQAR